MKANIRNIMIFCCVLLLVLAGIFMSDKLQFGKTIYVVSPEENEVAYGDEVSEQSYDDKKLALNKEMMVYISGEVKIPGVVVISEGDRMINAIEKLGGLTENADYNRINLAMKLEDGMHYIIPKVGENIDNGNSQITISSNTQNSSGKININRADEMQLKSLPGIGEAIAKRIVTYRDQNGGFKSIDEIKNVSGIGDKKFEDIKELISIN
ncbi:helix-hairpin-helix domain-containing protein [Alkalithermobacter paradoxus]|uniref:ComE operon protein 1 n=1 Tax=Alkalithermobacter paradoxus TaxID=29349 RepID=A0A1V4I6N5_9FIRM|nr:ComE operon protein 1 [[Clostridium] thermoalcaliphilum]